MKPFALALLAGAAAVLPAGSRADPIPRSFESAGADRRAIERLLRDYTVALSTKDRALFEGLLLSTDIPFSEVGAATRGVPGDDRNYAAFRRGVFEGPPFTQRFRDVTIMQDGPLAQVSLVFENTAADGRSWGWKTLQLLKVAGRWRIASEFYTGHPG